jgi:hypothetical protein
MRRLANLPCITRGRWQGSHLSKGWHKFCATLDGLGTRTVKRGEEDRVMTIQLFISGVVLGFLLGILYCRVTERQQYRVGRKGDIDRLIEQFQTLFRQIDREKQQRP